MFPLSPVLVHSSVLLWSMMSVGAKTKETDHSQGLFGWDVASQGTLPSGPALAHSECSVEHGVSPLPAELPALKALLTFLTFDSIFFFFQLGLHPHGLWDLSSLMTRDEPGPLQWKRGVLAQSGNSLSALLKDTPPPGQMT